MNPKSLYYTRRNEEKIADGGEKKIADGCLLPPCIYRVLSDDGERSGVSSLVFMYLYHLSPNSTHTTLHTYIRALE